MPATELRVAARDGFELAATRFDPDADRDCRAVVLIVPATASRAGSTAASRNSSPAKGFAC